MNDWILKNLPPAQNVETVNVFRALTTASRKLAELKGVTASIPNKDILINTLGLQESKYSSEKENIITTQDDLFRASVDSSFENIEAKEVLNYTDALKKGYELVQKNKLDYYKHLQNVRITNNYEDWIIWMLNGVEETTENTIKTIQEIKELMADYKHCIRNQRKII